MSASDVSLGEKDRGTSGHLSAGAGQTGAAATDASKTKVPHHAGGHGSQAAQQSLAEDWRRGIEAGGPFDGTFLSQYFRSVGLHGPPELIFTSLRAAGRPAFATEAAAETVAARVRKSRSFDAAFYRRSVPGIGRLDPALHYVIVGELFGYAPSEGFDPRYYRKRYPDSVANGEVALVDFLEYGKRAKRRPLSVASGLTLDRSRIDPDRETILIVSHQASRTGAPILAYNLTHRLKERYNVVVLLLSGGELREDFAESAAAVVGPLSYGDWHPVEASYIVERLLGSYEFKYAIANSIDSRIMMPPLTRAFVPVVALVHEFASHLKPPIEMGRALEWATQTVFSAQSVLESVRASYPNIDNFEVHVLPQGASTPPRARVPETTESNEKSLRQAMRPEGAEKALVVLGCGTVYMRKGVDLFIACAAAVAKLRTNRPVRFVWIGPYLPAKIDHGYSTYLAEHIARAGLEDIVTIHDEVGDLDPAYELADVLFLSSRLDPMPNVVIDAALHGKPVVCFDRAGGTPEIFGADETTRQGVVPYLDVDAAARLVARLADDEATLRKMGQAAQALARQHFDMRRYAQRIDEMGNEAARVVRLRVEDFETIRNDTLFDTTNFLGRDPIEATRDDAIRSFIARSAALGTGKRPTSNFYYRRPCVGFHPQRYAHENKARYEAAVVNPLAHFIRSGKPDGPWRHDVITPDLFADRAPQAAALHTALHAHIYYTELAPDLLSRIGMNRSPCDLFISTSSKDKASELAALTADYAKGKVIIRVVPNRGRDVGPFLTEFGALAMDYDIIGHVHTKRSLFAKDATLGESWREFLWQNLIGDLHPMMDIILARFSDDKTLGIAFPDDPHLSGWDANGTIATGLAAKMGFKNPLPPFFTFPIGTMFWARPNAIRPLIDLKLDWSDYPEEPIGIDGTILHALERLFPFAADHSGYRFATTTVPGVTW